MTAGFAFGGFDTCRDFGIVDIVVFLAVGTGDLHLKGSGFRVQGSEVQRFKSGRPLNLESFIWINYLI